MTNILSLPNLSSVSLDDAFYCVNDPLGTPADQQVAGQKIVGKWEPVQEDIVTVSQGHVAFTDLTSDFLKYRLEVLKAVPVVSAYPFVEISSDNGTTYETTLYDVWGMASSSPSVPYPNVGSNYTEASGLTPKNTAYSAQDNQPPGFCATMDIYCLCINDITIMKSNGIYPNGSGFIVPSVSFGKHEAAVAMNALRFAFNATDIASGHFLLHGLRSIA
ncbi:MAG: hypothetical protein ACRBBN_15140 [Methyloligellaceae bacterium]